MTLRWVPGPGNLILKNEMVEADPFFNNVSLLLHGDGANGSTTIVDSSPSSKTATLVGDVQISTAQSQPGFGGSSIVFDKVDDRITYSSSDFAFGTGDFTIEAWIFSRDVSSASARGWLQTSAVTGALQTSYNNGLAIFQGINGSSSSVNGAICVGIGGNNLFGSSGSPVALFANQWQHIAVTRSGSTCRVFVDGTEVGTRQNSSNLTGSNLVVGGYYSTSYLFDGYIDDLRITKGVARYTANFTPPTAPFPEVLG